MKKSIILLSIIGVIALGLIFFFISVSIGNTMVEMKGRAEGSWANVESSYQRRNDLIGNLVKTVQGAADFEKTTLTEVISARAKATSTTIDAGNITPQSITAFQQAQSGLTSALSKLMVVVERYPNLKANQNFLQLQNQLEGTENRINVERNRYNKSVTDFNIYIQKFPYDIIAKRKGFEKMTLYKSDKGSEKAPDVNFNKKN